MLPSFPVDGRVNRNLPLRPHFPIKPEPPYRGPWNVTWTEGPTGGLVQVKAPRHISPAMKRATLRLRGPWKSLRP